MREFDGKREREGQTEIDETERGVFVPLSVGVGANFTPHKNNKITFCIS